MADTVLGLGAPALACYVRLFLPEETVLGMVEWLLKEDERNGGVAPCAVIAEGGFRELELLNGRSDFACLLRPCAVTTEEYTERSRPSLTLRRNAAGLTRR